jgi:hypothetical protein
MEKIAYAKENNLYIYDLGKVNYADYYGRKENAIINGITDWVYEKKNLLL